MILGLTGSVGSGKSTVADMLRLVAQADIIDADAIVHELQRPGERCYLAIIEEFGKDILKSDGNLDRKKIAGIVFQDPERLQALNGIVHPAVWAAMQAKVQALTGYPLVVLMVPLLYEVGADRMCDAVAVVTVSDEERIRRLMERDGLTQEQVKARLAAQMPESEKIARADFVINNDGTPEQTLQQVKNLAATLAAMQG